MRATYVRLYADEKGQSHFEDVAIDLLPGFAVPPAEPLRFGSFLNLGKSRFISAPDAWRGDTPHPVPRRMLTIILQGTLAIIAGDGTLREFSSGDVILCEDTWGTGHSTRVSGEGLSLMVDVEDDPSSTAAVAS